MDEFINIIGIIYLIFFVLVFLGGCVVKLLEVIDNKKFERWHNKTLKDYRDSYIGN